MATRRKHNQPVFSSDGRKFGNLKEAAAAVHYQTASIYWAIYHRKRIGGLYWSYEPWGELDHLQAG